MSTRILGPILGAVTGLALLAAPPLAAQQSPAAQPAQSPGAGAAAEPQTAVAGAGDAEAGKKVFNKCRACHSVEAGKNMVGPSLAGVAGRKAGEVQGFNYSEAMKGAGITWTDENLHKYLADPKTFIPKNKMAFAGLKDETERQNVIAYLKTVQ